MKLNILFLCTGNSCRSQIAEGFAKKLKSSSLVAYSAGTQPSKVNEFAIEVMKEIGVDISGQTSKHINQIKHISFDYVITLCDSANENCPYFPGKKIHHSFDDPPKLAENCKSIEEKLIHYRRVRDDIGKFIELMPDCLVSNG